MADPSPAESLFFAALELPPGGRAAFLEDACRGDAGLRARLEKMLAAQPDLGNFLGQVAPTCIREPLTRAEEAPRLLAGAAIAGRYRLLGPIGEGGMGAVWVAEQLHPVTRRVAVKLIRGEYGGSRGVLARFEAERQAIALMDHPHIAKLLDAGTTGEAEALSIGAGRPYFVMELVDGLPLNEYCDRHRLAIPDRLRLFVQICRAVQHAHQKGIIHRDLKPSNILVEHHDGRPVPRVIDFGVAKATGGAKLPGETLFTRPGNVTGTPLYMAPEQADPASADIDTRADIYALGVNLYELLTGTTPIEQEQLKKVPLLELLQVIRDSDPPRPSQRLRKEEGCRRKDEARRRTGGWFRSLLPSSFLLHPSSLQELDWIVMKALAKERDRRYDTATAFAGDVERFLNHEPVLAGPPSTAYRLSKFVRRHRVQVIAAGLLLAALLAGVAGTTFGLLRAESQRGEAVRAWGQEAAQRGRAEKARDRTWEALEAMTSKVTGDALGTQKSLSHEQERFLAEALTYYREFAAEQGDDAPSRAHTAAAAARVGAIEWHLGRSPQAAAAMRDACDGYARLVADFPAVPDYRHQLAIVHNDLGLILDELGKASGAEAEIRKSLAIRRELADRLPPVPAHRRYLAAAHINLGAVLSRQRKPSEAVKEFRQALVVLEQLSGKDPSAPAYRRGLASCHNNLGGQLAILGDLPAAEKHLRKALAIQEKLAAEFQAVREYRAELAACHGSLRTLLFRLGKLEKAEEQDHNALVILEKLVAEYPGVPRYRHECGVRHNSLGFLLSRLGKGRQAQEEYGKALAIQEPLTAECPDVPEYRRGLADTHGQLGDFLRERGKLKDAEVQLRKAVDLREKLAAERATQARSLAADRAKLADEYNTLGLLVFNRGDRPEGVKQLRRGLKVREKLVADFPDVAEYQTALGADAGKFGQLLVRHSPPQEALVPLDLSVRTLTAAHERPRQAARARDLLCKSLGLRAITYHRLGKFAEALQDWDRALELETEGGALRVRAGRVVTVGRAGRVAEAVAEADKLLKLPNWNFSQLLNFASLYAQASSEIAGKEEEYAARAVGVLRQAVKAGWRDPALIAVDAYLAPLRERNDFKKVLADLQKK